MGYVIRTSLAGYEADTDTDIRHYSLYSDSDNILIKEQSRGSISVSGSGTATITHSLGYPPLFFVYAEVSSNVYEWVNGDNIYSDYRAYATTTTLELINSNASSKTFKYYIFYDNIIA